VPSVFLVNSAEDEAMKIETEMNIAVVADKPEKQPKEKFVNEFAERLAGKDVKMDKKIKDAADDVALIGILFALLFGFLLCDSLKGFLGFVIGLSSAGVLIFVAILLSKLLHRYGDMIHIYAEQKKILEQLERRKALEAFINGDVIMSPEAEEKDKPADNTEAEPDQATAETAAPDASETEDAQLEEYQDAALTVDIANRIAYFIKRPDDVTACPVCGRIRTTECCACQYCGCQFIYDDEAPAKSHNNDIERLRQLLQTETTPL
jgi:hypothetical protein